MNTKLVSALTLILFSQLCFAQVKEDTERIAKLYEDGNYSEAYLGAIDLRKMEYGKTVGVDYIIAKSLCSLGKKEKAVAWYKNMLNYYKLDNSTRNALIKDQQSCSDGNQSTSTSHVRIDVLNTLASMEKPESRISGKEGSVSFECDKQPQKFRTIRHISESEMESRLFSLDDGKDAIAKYSEILGDDYDIKRAGSFLIVTKVSAGVNQQQADKVSAQLQKTLDFFVSYYQLRPPNKLITVCLLPSTKELQKTAEILHGIQIPKANWGYSNIADLTLLGWSNTERIGTLNHEMFHLVIRTDVGDAPPWLDEGMASLYERSMRQSENIVGIEENWRTDVLKQAFESPQLRSRIPSLNDFLSKNWDEFDGDAAGDICNTSINYAYGRNFMVYLQRRDKLKQIFNLMKTRTAINSNYEITINSSVEVVEEAMEMKITDVEKGFINWFFEASGMNTR